MAVTRAIPKNITIIAGEALQSRDFINVYVQDGVYMARRASAAEDKPAHGFVLSGAAIGVATEVHFSGINPYPGLELGKRYFLDTNPGNVTLIPSEEIGHIVQVLGVAVPSSSNVTGIQFEYTDYISCSS